MAALWREARQFAPGDVDQCHSALLAKMKVIEEFHSTHCVGFAEWNWEGKGIDEGPAVKVAISTIT